MIPLLLRSAVRLASRPMLLALCSASALAAAPADDETADASPDFDIRGQATYVFQRKPSFSAAYSGPNSMSPLRERSYSFTTTAFIGWRPIRDLELYFNPEVVQGLPLSRLVGLGGLTNSELQKTAGTNPKAYRARAFVRKTWGLGGESEDVAAGANQLAGKRDGERVVLTAGNFAVSDIFDANSYAHDGRTQFLNWSFLTHGAYDYAADSRGYSWGAALEYYTGPWAFRIGRFMEPVQSNGLKLDWAIGSHHGDQLEVERRWNLGELPGKARLLLFRNTTIMGSFREALVLGAATGTTPDVGAVRRSQSKTGVGINLEQAIDDSSGVFLRLARHDGATETYSFTEIDRSLSVGGVLGGARWGRPQDTVGLAWARNGLSDSHRNYLAAGGLGFFLGDGALTYKPESIVETYYQFGFGNTGRLQTRLMVGFQRIRNPGYNAARGPVNVASVRLHAEF